MFNFRNDGDGSSINKDLLNAYNEHKKTHVVNLKLTLNYANAIDNLSTDNFEKIKTQLEEFQIDTREKVNIFVDSTFHRTIKGLEMHEMGAELCKALHVISTNSIKDMVLERVLYLFEQNSSTFKINLQLMRSNKNDAETDARIMGFTEFVIEFFKVGLFAVKYIHTHIQRMLDLNYICEYSVYLTCYMLLSCGTEIYNTNYQLGVLEKFVNQLKYYCQNTTTQIEVISNVKKIVELHQNKWQFTRIDVKEPNTVISREIPKIQTELSECINAKSTMDESSNYDIKSILSMILSDPQLTCKCVQEVAKLNDISSIELLLVDCEEELNKYFNILSLFTGKDEILDLIYKIQNEEDTQKRIELKTILDSRLEALNNAVIVVKFIGELYNSNLLDNRILSFMEYLLDYEHINENTVVCLCKFLAKVGNKLMIDEQGLEIYQKYSKKLVCILKNQSFNMPSHVKILIQEVIELKENL